MTPGWTVCTVRRSIRFLPALLAVLAPGTVAAQQVSDESFRFANPRPAYAPGEGPVVCIDEGHFNFHTAEGRYRSFAELLRGDGYRVVGFEGEFSSDGLQDCGLLVIANALSADDVADWTVPHFSAFSGAEIQGLMGWVGDGGRLLLFADHAPFPAAAGDLGAAFGMVMTDVYVDGGPGADVFRVSEGTLLDHPIRRGRSPAESIDSLVTFTGQPLQVTEAWDPLIRFGAEAWATLNPGQLFQSDRGNDWPGFSVAGWVHGAARDWGEGRIVVLGEAALCSAQVSGPERSPVGMNEPVAERNPQFCLNVARWLTGVLDSPGGEG